MSYFFYDSIDITITLEKYMPHKIKTLVTCTSKSQSTQISAKILANSLKIPLNTTLPVDVFSNLILTDKRLELHIQHEISQKPSILFTDFLEGKAGYRFVNNLTTKQPLAKAVGIKPGFRPDIIDATAGLGQDSFVLACLGCKIVMVERSPIIHALLADGMKRASQSEAIFPIVSENITTICMDSSRYLEIHSNRPHTIYMDPMYPHNPKAALNKKDMRIVRDIVGDDDDSEKLLEVALHCAHNRVVVKRPKRAEAISIPTHPSHTIVMKNSRFDVYMIHHL